MEQIENKGWKGTWREKGMEGKEIERMGAELKGTQQNRGKERDWNFKGREEK